MATVAVQAVGSITVGSSVPSTFTMNPLSGMPPVKSPGKKFIVIDVEGTTVAIVKFMGADGVSPTMIYPCTYALSPATF